MGGCSKFQIESDLFVLNIQSNELTKVAQEGPIKGFYSLDNAVRMVQEEEVIALVKDYKDKPNLIKFVKSSNKIIVIQKF